MNAATHDSPAAVRTEVRSENLRKLAFASIFAALTYVVFTYLQIPVPTTGGKVSVHLGNAFVVLGALMLGNPWGAAGGAVGLTIADLIDPVYIVEAPVTFLVKFLMGALVAVLAHRFGHITVQTDHKKVVAWVVAAAVAGLAFNVLVDPAARYVYKLLVLGKPAAEVTFAINFSVTLINSVVSAVIAVALYLALIVPLKKAGLFFRI